MGLMSMCHHRMTGIDPGKSNAAPGVTKVKRTALRAVTRLEYHKLVIMPRTTKDECGGVFKAGRRRMLVDGEEVDWRHSQRSCEEM